MSLYLVVSPGLLTFVVWLKNGNKTCCVFGPAVGVGHFGVANECYWTRLGDCARDVSHSIDITFLLLGGMIPLRAFELDAVHHRLRSTNLPPRVQKHI